VQFLRALLDTILSYNNSWCCWKCDLQGIHTCFSCRRADRETESCAVSTCGRFYHRSCALQIESTQLHKGRIHCPLHTCATCFADADDDDDECLRRQAVRGTNLLLILTLSSVLFCMFCEQIRTADIIIIIIERILQVSLSKKNVKNALQSMLQNKNWRSTVQCRSVR